MGSCWFVSTISNYKTAGGLHVETTLPLVLKGIFYSFVDSMLGDIHALNKLK